MKLVMQPTSHLDLLRLFKETVTCSNFLYYIFGKSPQVRIYGLLEIDVRMYHYIVGEENHRDETYIRNRE